MAHVNNMHAHFTDLSCKIRRSSQHAHDCTHHNTPANTPYPVKVLLRKSQIIILQSMLGAVCLLNSARSLLLTRQSVAARQQCAGWRRHDPPISASDWRRRRGEMQDRIAKRMWLDQQRLPCLRHPGKKISRTSQLPVERSTCVNCPDILFIAKLLFIVISSSYKKGMPSL